jgi:hypothetical protein
MEDWLMRNNQAGIGAGGIFLIIFIFGLSSFAFYRVQQADDQIKQANKITTFDECVDAGHPVMETYPEQCAADGQTFINPIPYGDDALGGESFKYTDSAGIYSLTYPSNMKLNLGADCCDGAPKEWSKISRPITLIPLVDTQIDGMDNNEGLSVEAGDRELKSSIENNWQNNSHTPEIKTINNYSAQHVKVVFNGDAEQYVLHQYLITSLDKTVYFSFRESYKNSTISIEFDASEYIPLYESVIASLEIK